jgi:hypothetical protein
VFSNNTIQFFYARLEMIGYGGRVGGRPPTLSHQNFSSLYTIFSKLGDIMCASQNTPVCKNYQTVNKSIYSNGDLDLRPNDPKINRVLPLPQGNHVVKFGKDPIYRTKVIMWKRPCCQKFYL